MLTRIKLKILEGLVIFYERKITELEEELAKSLEERLKISEELLKRLEGRIPP